MLSESKIRILHFYDGAAKEYARRDEGLKRTFHNASEFDWLRDFDLRPCRVLDAGTGTGRFLRYLKDRSDRPAFCTGVDLSIEMLKVARERISGCGFSLLRCDGEMLPFRDQSFDLVTCFGLLEYVCDLRNFLREFFRVTAPGGHLLFTCRNLERWSPFPNGHYTVADHTWEAVERQVKDCGYRLLRHETIYHMHGRWIWGMARLARPLGCDFGALRLVLGINAILRDSVGFRFHGKTHLVLAQRAT